MKRGILLFSLLCAACATPHPWVKDGATQEDLAMESAQCKAQAFAVPNAPMMQIAMVYNACMQGKGWHQAAH
jgi:hypothetical protein